MLKKYAMVVKHSTTNASNTPSCYWRFYSGQTLPVFSNSYWRSVTDVLHHRDATAVLSPPWCHCCAATAVLSPVTTVLSMLCCHHRDATAVLSPPCCHCCAVTADHFNTSVVEESGQEVDLLRPDQAVLTGGITDAPSPQLSAVINGITDVPSCAGAAVC